MLQSPFVVGWSKQEGAALRQAQGERKRDPAMSGWYLNDAKSDRGVGCCRSKKGRPFDRLRVSGKETRQRKVASSATKI